MSSLCAGSDRGGGQNRLPLRELFWLKANTADVAGHYFGRPARAPAGRAHTLAFAPGKRASARPRRVFARIVQRGRHGVTTNTPASATDAGAGRRPSRAHGRFVVVGCTRVLESGREWSSGRNHAPSRVAMATYKFSLDRAVPSMLGYRRLAASRRRPRRLGRRTRRRWLDRGPAWAVRGQRRARRAARLPGVRRRARTARRRPATDGGASPS